ncbi:MAG: zinc-dependent metalloprotease [Solirubrobacteraceae bacterium]|nr:zinc-dependent metalloprotease [Solirubrobacteraceae bacterium]
MLDPNLAAKMAITLAGGAGETGIPPVDLITVCDTARDRIVGATGMTPAQALPPPEWIDREAWAKANAVSLSRLLQPLGDRAGGDGGPLSGPLRAAAAGIATAEAGALLGLVANRVLGQYDLTLTDPDVPARLLFVAPNIAAAAERLDADHGEMLTWIALHEVTHAVQFSSVTWLRPHLSGLLHELLDSLDIDVDWGALLRIPSMEDLKGAVDAVREGGFATLLGSARGEVLDQVQATMALVEGHAEWAMDVVASDLVPNVADLRAALDRRRAERSGLLRFVDRLLGLDLKMRQYEEGRAFCDTVVELGGVELLSRAWSEPEAIPTAAELADASAWRARVA